MTIVSFTEDELAAVQSGLDDRSVYLTEYARQDGLTPEEIREALAIVESALAKTHVALSASALTADPDRYE